jgi:DNA-binding response OmpR family regulator
MTILGAQAVMPRILTVEDDTDLLFIYELTFSRQGYEVVSVDDMSKAIVYLTQDDFDLIILDINMPDMPGTKLIEFIQGDARLQHIPIIVVSAGERWKNEVYSR